MQKYNPLRKGTALVVLVLFIGVSIIPLTGSIIVEKLPIPTFTDPTIVSIQPSAQTVEKGESFIVSVYIEPGEPIIGASFEYLYFDPTLIHANSVVEGGLFDPWNWLFGYDHIDNVNGKIICVWGLTIPAVGITDSGYLCNISFTAQQQSGTSYLDLEGVIVINETGSEVPLVINDGTVTVLDDEPPQITDVTLTTSEPLDTEPGFGWENFSCTVTDDSEVYEVKLIVDGPWWPPEREYPMNNIPTTDIFYCNLTFTSPCTYYYHIWANDTSSNENVSEQYTFWLPSNCDIDMSGIIHFMDFIAVSMAYNEEGPPGWIREDLDNNGKVHFMDLIYLVIYCLYAPTD